MNDRLKFRIFSKSAKKFIYFDKPELSIDRENMGLLFRSEHLYLGNYEELQQCTGLKDVKGNPIYEGDIVKIFHVSGTMEGKHFIDVVEWNKVRCRFDTEIYGIFDDDDVYEVIGNIYENKALLEGAEE